MLSPTKNSDLKTLLNNALTTKINDREMFLKGIDYSYYYEENDYLWKNENKTMKFEDFSKEKLTFNLV